MRKGKSEEVKLQNKKRTSWLEKVTRRKIKMDGFCTDPMDDPNINKLRYFLFLATRVAIAPVKVRLGFIRKVYGILTAQLLLTTVTAAVFMFTESIKNFVQQSPRVLYLGFIMSTILVIQVIKKRKESPTNMYLLFAFTLCEAYTIGTVVTFYDQFVVLQAFILTIGTTIALTAYTFQSKRDFSSWGAGLFTVLWILVLAVFMQIMIPSKLVHVGIAVVGAILFSCFIIYDTHMLIHKLSPEEYITASIYLYLDIINLFLEILSAFDTKKKKH